MEKQIIIDNKTTSYTLVFRVLYFILIAGMFAGGVSQLIGIDYQVAQFTRLGYPPYFMAILGTAKVLAAVVLVIRKWPLFIVAAYVGAFIVSVCAFLSHLISGDSMLVTFNPLVLTAIAVGCCWLDPVLKPLRQG